MQDSGTRKVDGGYLAFGVGPRHPVLLAARTYDELPKAPASAPTFLKQDMNPGFLLLPDSSLLLVLSVSSLDPSTATTLVSRVDATPRQLWSVDVGGTCQHAEVLAGSLLVATSDPSRHATAVDVETGKVLWQFAF